MSSNHHDEAGPSFSRLRYEYEWRNECRALSFTANPKKFLYVDTFSFVEPRACGPPLSVGSIGWIRQVKVNVRSSKDGASPSSLSFSLGSQNEDACYLLYWTFDQAFYPCRIGTNHHCIALEQLSGRRPATSVHRYRFILRTWSNLTTLRGLVRSQSSLVRRNWTKKRECSTGTTANKDRNYIDNRSSLSPSLRRTVWRLERKTTLPSRRWCQ